MLIIDTMVYERCLYTNGLRGVMQDPKNEKPRAAGSNLSLDNLLSSLTLPLLPRSPSADPEKGRNSRSPQPPAVVLPKCTLHNAGNDALMCLFAFQKLLDPKGTLMPTTVPKKSKAGNSSAAFSPPFATPMLSNSISMPMININGAGPTVAYTGFAVAMMPPSMPTLGMIPRPSSSYDLAEEFGQMQVSQPRGNSGGSGSGGKQQQQYLTSPSRLTDRNSKRYNSFSTAKREG